MPTENRSIEQQSNPIKLAETRSRRVYIAGPMTGLPEFNFPAFNAMAATMRAEGWHVENPAEHGIADGSEWADYLRYDIGRLATCEQIMLLPGWSKSKGANLEVHIARQLCMPIKLAEGAEPAEQRQGEPVHMVRTHGSDCWEEISGESLELCQADKAEYEVRTLYTHPDSGEVDRLRYKAELYDEVWDLVTGLGYMNVTTAVTTLRAEREQLQVDLTARDELIDQLRTIGARDVRHVNNGSCPDEIEGHAARDNECRACQTLMVADQVLDKS